MEKRILVVDDERDICEILSFNLQNEGYAVDVAGSAEQALATLQPDHSLILLDVMMGGMSGYHLAEKLRREGNPIPIIFLTAKDTENDMLTGFSVGGDDYISKPFSLKEVSARVRAVLKRAADGASGGGDRLTVGDMTLDVATKELSIGGEAVAVTKTEFEILSLLASNPSRIFSREEIIDRLWRDAPYTTERTVDVHITRLRKKLGEKASCISSRAGYGYRFNAEGL
ncbi:MAG: response regulator transcription factor [Alistipes sp.]|jgi:DNA-binding response OmpR family regulator|nr:response regulator transcription factor [Alistipes sp.]